MTLWEGFEKTVVIGVDLELDIYVDEGELCYTLFFVGTGEPEIVREGVLYEEE